MTSGGRELLKWLALVLMVGDHVNAAWWSRSVPWLYDLGRVVMPTFAAVLACNLAGAGNVENGRYLRTIKRLMLVGVIAYPFHVWALGQGWFVANILLGYALAVGCMYWVDRYGSVGWMISAVAILIGGSVVEFYWAAPLVTLAWWCWWRRWSLAAFLWLLASFGALCLVNGNAWALVALPLVLLARNVAWTLQRRPWAFYVFYPAHLAFLVTAVNLNY
jgi:hypothetical protein